MKFELETAPGSDLDEAVFQRSISYSPKIKQYSSLFKHNWVQDRIEHTLEDYKLCLENNEIE